MTNTEKAIFAKNFLARRTSRIVSAQNGFNDVMTQFAAGTYNGDTQEEANADTNGAPTDTQRVDDISGTDGTVPGGSNDDTDITGALDILQKHIESLGDKSLLDLWASTSDALKKTASGDFVQKAVANKDGSTESVRHVSDNTAGQNAGSHGYISTSELSRMESEAAQLTKMTSKIVGVTAL
jgi:hypothetical protein